jgi:dynein heavy chain
MPEDEFLKFLLPAFCFALSWTLAGTGDTRTRKMFERDIEETFNTVSMPRNGGCYDGYINFHDNPKFKNWKDLVPSFHYSDELTYFQLMVPSGDTCRTAYLADRMCTSQYSQFLTGVSGIGKSVILTNLLEKMKESANVVPVFMTFSAQSKALATQLSIEGKLEKKRKTLLGAPVNKTIVIFIDDVNMPMIEEYGAQPPIELLRMFQDQRGFFDRKKHDWKDIENVTLLLCSGPPGGGRNPMTARFTRHSHVLCMTPTSEEAMTAIFGSILGGFLHRFKPEIQNLAASAVAGQSGVGQLMEIAVKKGKSSRRGIKLGICGEHGGDPKSVKFCHNIGLNYVSCSPFRVPTARLAAAQAAVS